MRMEMSPTRMRIRLGEKSSQSLRNHTVKLVLPGKALTKETAAQKNIGGGVQRAKLRENGVAFHYREEEIKYYQPNLLTELPKNFNRFRAIVSDHDFITCLY